MNSLNKSASFIKRMFDEGNTSVFVEVGQKSFNIGFQPFRGSENAFYLGNNGQSLIEIENFLKEKQNYINSQPKSIKRFYRRY